MPKGSWREFNHSESIARTDFGGVHKSKSDKSVRVRRTRAGKSGKIVTVITGLELPDQDSRSLLKALKSKCGSGGTSKDDHLEIQGDHVSLVLELLQNEGYRPKQAGG